MAQGAPRSPIGGAITAVPGIRGGHFTESREPIGPTAAILRGALPPSLQAGMATTIGVVASDAALTKAQCQCQCQCQCQRLAEAAHDGLARTIAPSHTMSDGDTVFALATGKSGLPGNMLALGAIVPQVMAAKGIAPSPPGMSELG